MLYTSPLPSVEIPLVPITEFVLRRVEDHPDRPALIDGASGRTYSFAELSDVIHRLAGGLAARGFGPGDTLALMAPNLPEYAIVFHAVAVAGGVVTTVNPTYGAEEIAFQLRDAGATEL
ncbi:MAG: AMP-binding protein, partial [Ilumatobacteraceae bacterium]|nr:AMP-binding protein [Ilumatobacteraceae bacterium]